MRRLIVQLPEHLLASLDNAKPEAQSRSEWVREAIRYRLICEAKRLESGAEMSQSVNQ